MKQGFIAGPPIWGPCSEKFGRKLPIVFGLATSGIWTIMAAVATNAATLLVARFFSGLMGAAPISIVGGAATDNWNAIDRAVALASVIGAVFSGKFFLFALNKSTFSIADFLLFDRAYVRHQKT